MRTEALTDDDLDSGLVDGGMNCGVGGAGDAVVGPQCLVAQHIERRFPRMCAGEGEVAGRVPILGGEGVREPGQQAVDDRHDGVGVRDR